MEPTSRKTRCSLYLARIWRSQQSKGLDTQRPEAFTSLEISTLSSTTHKELGRQSKVYIQSRPRVMLNKSINISRQMQIGKI